MKCTGKVANEDPSYTYKQSLGHCNPSLAKRVGGCKHPEEL